MRISDAVQAGFISEMEKLAQGNSDTQPLGLSAVSRAAETALKLRDALQAKKKEAAFLQNVGKPIVQTGKWLGRHVQGAGANIGTTLQKTFTNPLKATKEGWDFTIRGAGEGGKFSRGFSKAMLGLQGLQVAGDIKGLAQAEDPAGRGRGERLGNLIGSTAGGFIGAPHGLSGGIVGGEVARRGLGAVGKGADKLVAKLRRKPEAVVPMQPQPGQEPDPSTIR